MKLIFAFSLKKQKEKITNKEIKHSDDERLN